MARSVKPKRARGAKPLPLSAMGSLVQSASVFDAASVLDLAKEVRLPLASGALPDKIADDLDEAVSNYVLLRRTNAHSSAGDAALFAAGLREGCDALLARLGAHDALVGVSAPLDPLTILVQRPGSRGRGVDFALRQFCRRTRDFSERDGALHPDVWKALQTVVDGVRFLAVIAAEAEAGYSAEKGKKRTPNTPLVAFFRAISLAYEAAFRRGVRVSNPPLGGEPSGPAIRFARAVLVRAVAQIPRCFDRVPERDAALLRDLEECAASAHSIAGRLADARRGGSIRKR